MPNAASIHEIEILQADLNTVKLVAAHETQKFQMADKENARLRADLQRLQTTLLTGIDATTAPSESVERALGIITASLAVAAANPLLYDRVTVRILGYDRDRKVPAIKTLRQWCPGLGLKEAKDLVEGAPSTLGTDIPRETALHIVAHMREAGATVEMYKPV